MRAKYLAGMIAFSSLILNFISPDIAFAMSVSRTCSTITSPFAIPIATPDLDLTVSAGDSVTFSLNPGKILAGNATLTLNGSAVVLALVSATGGSASFLFTADGVYTISSGGSEVTVTCTPKGSVADTPKGSVADAQNSFTQTQVINQLSTLYYQMSANASASLSGNNPNSINAQGFNVSTNSIADRAESDVTSHLNLWASGKYNHFDGSSVNGYIANLIAGVDYKKNESTLYGALVSYGKTEFDTLLGTSSGELNASSFTGGVYAAKNFDNGLILDGLLAYTNTAYDIVNGSEIGSFGANRIGFSAGIYNSFDAPNGWVIEPSAKLIIAHENQNAYTDSANNSISARSITSGRIALGPKVYFDKEGIFSPWTSIDVQYDFTSATTISTNLFRSNGNLSLRPAFGFDYKMRADTNLHFDANVGNLGAPGYTSYGLAIVLSHKF